MPNTANDIHSRLKSLDKAIKAHKAKLELHGIFNKDHHLTEKNIRDRWNELQREIKSELHDDKSLHSKADWLHGKIIKWIASTDLDFKS